MKQNQDDGRRSGRQRYYPDDRRDEQGRRYQSAGYQEEQGDFGDPDRTQGPDRQARDWQARQHADEQADDTYRGGGRQQRGGRYRGSQGSGWNEGYRPGGEDRFGAGQYGAGQYDNRQDAYEPYGAGPFGPGGYRNRQGGASYGSGRYWRPEHEDEAQRQGQQGFRGRGPKGFQRSDERLREMICEKLTDDDRIDASEVTVEVKNGEVKLAGTVSDRQTKYQIEEAVEDCSGVKDVDNQLRVNRAAEDQGRKVGAERGGRKTQQGGSSTGAGATTGGAGI